MKRVLVAPLDWGLGHATRCIPVIRELLAHGADVQLASSGSALTLLLQEFPQLKHHALPSYAARYSRWVSPAVSVLLQWPRLRSVIRDEHQVLQAIIAKEKIDIVISDNRYGCWSPDVDSVFIGHQLNLQAPMASRQVNAFHLKMIRRFHRHWIPDFPEFSLAGSLTQQPSLQAEWVGWLSRFLVKHVEPRYDVMAITSGPEPQRSQFEKILYDQLSQHKAPCLLVAGKPDQHEERMMGQLKIVSHLDSAAMNDALLSSRVIVARSGYSTLMDLAVLQRTAIVIPTPGQPEQEYLGHHAAELRLVHCVKQHEFSLSGAMRRLPAKVDFPKPEVRLPSVVKRLLNE